MLRRTSQQKRKGAALVEYATLVGGIVLVALAAVAILGHKTTDLVAATASILPGAHADDNGPIVSGKLVETTGADTGQIAVDAAAIVGNTDTTRLGNNLGVVGLEGEVGGTGGLVLEP